jgi:hypothetical protein
MLIECYTVCYCYCMDRNLLDRQLSKGGVQRVLNLILKPAKSANELRIDRFSSKWNNK